MSGTAKTGTAKTTEYVVESILPDVRRGRMVIIVDDEDRENEGDLVIPAQMATPDAINFMAKHGRGLICLSLTRARAEQLRLESMVRSNGSRTGTIGPDQVLIFEIELVGLK